jgi:hypothetical protein
MNWRTLVTGALFAAGVAITPAIANALTTFSAYDDGASTASAAANSNAAQVSFSTTAGPTDLISFEGPSLLGDTNGKTLVPGVTLGTDVTTQEIANADPNGCGSPVDCGFNITPGGSQWADVNGGTLTFNFASPITSFGAHLTGVNLADSIQVNGSTVVSVPVTSTALGDGGVSFLGFTGSAPVTQVIIVANGPLPGDPGLLVSDTIGVDNVQYTAWDAPVPEPATWTVMLLGIGAIGGALRRASPATRLALFPAAN